MRLSLTRYLKLSLWVRAALALAVLAPTMWLCGRMPIARSIVLPSFGLLTLALLLTHQTGMPRREEKASGEEPDWPERIWAGWRSLGHLMSAHPAGTGPGIPVLLCTLWVGFSVLRAAADASPGVSGFARGELLRFLACIAVYVAVSRAMRSWHDAKRLLDLLLIAVIAAVMIALAVRSPLEPALSGAFGNPQLFAAFLLLMAPVALAQAIGARNPRRRLLAQVAAVMALAGLALAQTRSAWIGGTVALTTLALLLRALPHRRRRRRDPRPALATAVLAVGGLAWIVCHTDVAGPLLTRAVTLAHLGDDEGMAWRLRQWSVALSLVRERPVMGIGPGCFPLAAAQRLPAPLPLDVVLATGPNLALNIHNLYLQTLVETGLIGLSLLLWCQAACFLTGLRALRRVAAAAGRRDPGDEEEDGGRTHGDGGDRGQSRSEERARYLLLASCLAALTGAAVDALANPAYQYLDVALPLWLLLGLCSALSVGQQRVGAPMPRSTSMPRHAVSRVTAPRLAAAFAATVLLIAGSVAGDVPPAPIAEYVPYESLRVEALTTRGYLKATLLQGECVELRARGTLQRAGEQDVTSLCRFSRAGGTAAADCLEQLPPPNDNLFCFPTGVPASYDGQTVQLQGTLIFNGQTLTSQGPMLTLSVPRACPGIVLIPTPRVLPPTGELIEVKVSYTDAGFRFDRLLRVECTEPLGRDDVRVKDSTHVLLRGISTTPGRRIYTLYFRFKDRYGLSWTAPVQVYVR